MEKDAFFNTYYMPGMWMDVNFMAMKKKHTTALPLQSLNSMEKN
jgi:hypothetical protein